MKEKRKIVWIDSGARTASVLMGLIPLLLLLAITGCSFGEHNDLQEYIRSVKSRPSGRIAPVPEFHAYETFAYSAESIKDPFSVVVSDTDTVGITSASQLRPDMQRNREALEEYPLDTLKFVGHLEKGGERWAIITSPDRLVHKVKTGNYLGSNYGEIVTINESSIEIKEIVTDGLGGWIEREAALSLSE